MLIRRRTARLLGSERSRIQRDRNISACHRFPHHVLCWRRMFFDGMHELFFSETDLFGFLGLAEPFCLGLGRPFLSRFLPFLLRLTHLFFSLLMCPFFFFCLEMLLLGLTCLYACLFKCLNKGLHTGKAILRLFGKG